MLPTLRFAASLELRDAVTICATLAKPEPEPEPGSYTSTMTWLVRCICPSACVHSYVYINVS